MTMKNTKDQQGITLYLKFFIGKLYSRHFFACNLVFCCCCLLVGITLTFKVKKISFNFYIQQFQNPLFSFNPPSHFSPPPISSNNSTTSNYHNNQTNFSTNQNSLEDFSTIPMAMHDMNDDELFRRASLISMSHEIPFNQTSKVAFMFLTTGHVLLAPFWEKFFKGNEGLYSIYIHPSPSLNQTVYNRSSVFHGRRIPSKEVKWGETSMIEAERRLLANALLDFSNQRFVLLSESCIPLFNFSTIYTYLMNSNKTFVEANEIKLSQWKKGSQWFQIDRYLALQIVSDKTYFPMFKKFCNPPCYSDEHYLPTFISNEFGKRNSNRTLTWVDWSKGGPHPSSFIGKDVTIKFLERLRFGSTCEYNGRTSSICHLFARKFTPQALDRLVRYAPKLMQFN